MAPSLKCCELDLLAELGFGLDLAACAATGMPAKLVLCLAQKSGRAVSRGAAGERWKDKLLALPRFLSGEGGGELRRDRRRLRSPAFFLARRVYEPRGLEL